MYNKIDLAQFSSESNTKNKKQVPQTQVRKGTVDYSKWDNLSDGDADDD